MATKFNIKRSLWLVLLILSFWKESRDFCLWIMQTRFISDAFIFILGKTCQILFSWRSHFRWTVGLFDWLPDFLTSCFFGLVQAIPNISQMNPNRNPFKNFIPFVCVFFFLDQTMWICPHCFWPELLFFKSGEWWNSIFEARTSLQKRLGPDPNKGSNQEKDAMERKLRCRGWELIVNMEE